MAAETWITCEADPRAVATNAANPAVLGALVADWPVPVAMPTATARLWHRACSQLRSGPIAYENFTDAVRTGFEAVDSALRHRVPDLVKAGERVTFGRLIERAEEAGRLSPHQYEWLSTYALHFRNRLTHADLDEPLVLTPPMAADMLAGIARFLANVATTGMSGKRSR